MGVIKLNPHQFYSFIPLNPALSREGRGSFRKETSIPKHRVRGKLRLIQEERR